MSAAEPDGPAAQAAPLRLGGACHCGTLELTFETARNPGELAIRACGCSFCRRHGARTTSDPQGRVELVVHDASLLNRYRFGLNMTEFLVCRTCGVYVGAVMADGKSAFAIVNITRCTRPRSLPRPRCR